MKEFMMIFVGGDYEEAGYSPDDIQNKLKLWNKWIEELKEQGLYIEGRALKSNSTEVSNDQGLSTNGPFVEINELVTGYIVVKANDLEHAKVLSKDFPEFDLGAKVRIREIETFE